MNSRQQELRHLAYFEHLAGLEETDAEWRAGTAGLVVLRLLDAWLEEGPELVRAGSWSFEAARAEVEAISGGDPARTILGGVLEGMADQATPTMTPIAPRLMAYGRALNLKAQWRIAADVYGTILQHAHPQEDMDVLIDARMRLAYCLRMQGDFGAAMAEYAEAGRLARETGDIIKVLRVRIADAKMAMDRGNLPDAEAILEETIQRAEAQGLREVRATALHDRADLAHRQGDFERAVCLAHSALDDVQDPIQRDRVLADMAASFFELGIRSAARDAHLILAATAQEQYVRWVAALNLLEIAALDESEPLFEQYRRELADAPLPPRLETLYSLYVGRGHGVFGHVDAAREWLRNAVHLASRHGFSQILFEAETSLGDVEREQSTRRPLEVEPSDAVKPIVREIRTMRSLAGI